jgi:hypothetical protein
MKVKKNDGGKDKGTRVKTIVKAGIIIAIVHAGAILSVAHARLAVNHNQSLIRD